MLDPLSDVLSLLRVESALSARLEARGDWALSFPAYHQVLFGTAIMGPLQLMVGDSSDAIELRSGDCYLLTRGQPYRLASRRDVPTENGRHVFDSTKERDGIVRYGTGPLNAIWAGGTFRLDDDSSDLLLKSLPPIIYLPAGSVDQAPLRAAIDLITTETANMQPGAGAIAESLANIVMVQILRVYLKGTTRPPGWLGATADDHIGNALALMHKHYARHWTVGDLANEVAMSRTAFAVRFKALVGVPPLEYLTQWRMAVACRELKMGKNVSVVAEGVGYCSDTAFIAAFKRAVGQNPGSYRGV
jgi:AraC-like DNA-binding protein